MKQKQVELMVGIFIAFGIAALVMLAMKVSNIASFTEQEGFEVVAKFNNIGGLKPKAPVSMGGVRIGRVVNVKFDQEQYVAVVHMRILPEYDRIPQDTSAGIFTSGVLGESYIGLEAGAEDQYLKDGSEITLTQSAIVLENLIGKFLFDKAAGDGGAEKADAF